MSMLWNVFESLQTDFLFFKDFLRFTLCTLSPMQLYLLYSTSVFPKRVCSSEKRSLVCGYRQRYRCLRLMKRENLKGISLSNDIGDASSAAWRVLRVPVVISTPCRRSGGVGEGGRVGCVIWLCVEVILWRSGDYRISWTVMALIPLTVRQLS